MHVKFSCFIGNEVKRVESYKYLGFGIHATRNLAHGVSPRVAACLCCKNFLAFKSNEFYEPQMCSLSISDPKTLRKLFDSLVLPILSYAGEVWGVDGGIGDATAWATSEAYAWRLGQHCKLRCTS